MGETIEGGVWIKNYVHAEHIIGIENVETMLSELKAVHNVLENI